MRYKPRGALWLILTVEMISIHVCGREKSLAGRTFITLHIMDGDLADPNRVVVVVDRILPWLVSVVRILVYTTELIVVGVSLVALAVLVVVYTTAATIATGVSAACCSCP